MGGGGQQRKWATSPTVGHALGKLGGMRTAYGEGLTHLRAFEWVRLRAVTNRRLCAVANRASHCAPAVPRVSCTQAHDRGAYNQAGCSRTQAPRGIPDPKSGRSWDRTANIPPCTALL